MSEINEIWKDIEGYEGLYQVSTLGRVKSLGRMVPSKNGSFRKEPEKLLKPQNGRYGYKKKIFTKYIHYPTSFKKQTTETN